MRRVSRPDTSGPPSRAWSFVRRRYEQAVQAAREAVRLLPGTQHRFTLCAFCLRASGKLPEAMSRGEACENRAGRGAILTLELA